MKKTKADMINSIWENVWNKVDIKKKDINTIYESFINQIKYYLINNNTIELRNFGTFEIRLRKGRKDARNPKTGELCPSKDRGAVIFRSGRELKEKVSKLK